MAMMDHFLSRLPPDVHRWVQTMLRQDPSLENPFRRELCRKIIAFSSQDVREVDAILRDEQGKAQEFIDRLRTEKTKIQIGI